MTSPVYLPMNEKISEYNYLVTIQGFSKEDASLSYYHIHYKDGKMNDPKFGEYFFEQDILGLLNYTDIEEADIIIIDSLYVKPELRSSGLAKEMLKFITHYHESLIFTQCVALQKEYPECPDEDKIQEIIAGAMSYFIMNGFTSINDYSCFENREAMIYVNKIAKPIIEYTCKLHRGCKSVWPEEAFKAKADEDDFQPDKNLEEEVSKDNEG